MRDVAFNYTDDFQELIQACQVRHNDLFGPFNRILEPKLFNGEASIQVALALSEYYDKNGFYPTFPVLADIVYKRFYKKMPEKAEEFVTYVIKLADLDLRDHVFVRDSVVGFARERALLNAIKIILTANETKEEIKGGIVKLVEDAENVGNEIETGGARSLTDYAENSIDDFPTVLGRRFLCPEGGMLLIGPSGVGKSSASAQQDIAWALGKEAFGVMPARQLRILTVQGENDDGDLTEMAQGIMKGLGLTSSEREIVRANTRYVCHKTMCGEEFLTRCLAPLLHEHRPDLVRLDPLNCYLGGDPSDPKIVTPFLRTHLNPILARFRCAAILNHHTPKIINRDTSKWRPIDFAYAGAGNNELTNWARAIIAIDPTDHDHLYKFIAAKRGSRLGWADKEGRRTCVRYFTQSRRDDEIFWKEPTDEDMASIKSSGKTKTKPTKKEFLGMFPAEYDGSPKAALLSARELRSKGREKGWRDDDVAALREEGCREGWLGQIDAGRNTLLTGRPEIVEAYRDLTEVNR